MWMTNEKRRFFKLSPIHASWDAVQLTSECTIYFDGETIVKRIVQREDAYLEKDIDIKTRERQYILPKTARGKEKKLTYPNLYNRHDGALLFQYGVFNHQGFIELTHVGTKRALPFSSLSAESLVEVEEALSRFIQSPPATYEEKLALLFTKLKRHKIKVGDVFKVERSMTTHSYVVVIGHVLQIRKAGLLEKDSIWNDLMTVPLFVRVYNLETDDNLTVNQIKELPMYEGCQTVMDDQFMRGQFPYVGQIELREKDIELPFGFGPSLNAQATHSRISWGLATVVKDGAPPVKYNLNHSVSVGVAFKHMPFDHQNYEQARQFFGLEQLDFDTFNERYNGLTKAQYLNYVQPKLRERRDKRG